MPPARRRNHAAVRKPRRQTFPSFRRTPAQFTQRSLTSRGRPSPLRILPPSLGGSRVLRPIHEHAGESRGYCTQERMSTFEFAIEGDENFSACGAICIACRSFTTCTDDGCMVLPVASGARLRRWLRLSALMHGESFDAHALNVQRVFAMQRTPFYQPFDVEIGGARELNRKGIRDWNGPCSAAHPWRESQKTCLMGVS